MPEVGQDVGERVRAVPCDRAGIQVLIGRLPVQEGDASSS